MTKKSHDNPITLFRAAGLKVRSIEDMRVYGWKGMYPPEELSKLYPALPLKEIYFGVQSPAYYINNTDMKGAAFPLELHGEVFIGPMPLMEYIEHMRQKIQNERAQGDYSLSCAKLPSEMQWMLFLQNLGKRYIPQKYLYESFRKVFLASDRRMEDFEPWMLKRIIARIPKERKAMVAETLQSFPDTVPIYRVQTEKGDEDSIYTWYLDKDFAIYEGVKGKPDRAKLYMGTVTKADVIDVFIPDSKDISEAQLFLDPQTVTHGKIMNFIMHPGSGFCLFPFDYQKIGLINKLSREVSEMCTVSDAYVMSASRWKLSTQMAGTLGYDEYELSALAYASIFIYCCTSEAIGTERQGMEAAEVYRNYPFKNELAEFILENQHLEGKELRDTIKEHFPQEQQKRMKQLMDVFYDAGELCKVYYGYRAFRIDNLRTYKGKRMVCIAWSVVHSVAESRARNKQIERNMREQRARELGDEYAMDYMEGYDEEYPANSMS